MAQVYLGPQGWTSDAVVRTEYPPGTRPGKYLEILSRTLSNSLEANNTFWSVPNESTVMGWERVLPAGYIMSVKMYKGVTHDAKLINAESMTEHVLKRYRLLGDHLGCVALQFDKHFHSGYFAALAKYLTILPTDIRFAVEVRHNSWMTQDFRDLLTAHGVAMVLSDSWGMNHREQVTAKHCYIRLNANDVPVRAEGLEQLVAERERELVGWANLARRLRDKGTDVYIYANDCVEGNAAATVRSLQRKLGIERPGQGQLRLN